ncbi:Uroporphyrinogen decarboxylase [bacterium HR16]|nr:Uroporphyrinogen decarboxylase [bacterium HR16]
MTPRERVLKALRREEPDRVPIHDGLWAETVRRWQREGLPAEIPAEDYFGYEIVGIGFDPSPMFEVKTLYKDDHVIVQTTPYGGVRKNFRTYASTPEIIDWAVKSKEDWLRIKERLRPDYTRVDWVSLRQRYQQARSENKCIVLTAAVGYDHLQSYVKSEELLVIMHDDPDWFRDMVQTHALLVLEMARMILDSGYPCDAAFLFNDMGYRNGPLFSPKMYRECIMDSDKMLCDFFHSRGMPVIYHTDGDVRLLIPGLIEAGIDCLQPLEAKANMDVRELKKQYGDRLAFMGNIDTRKMADPDPSVIEEEIRSKFEVAMKGGGYLYHSDHSVPPSVSFEQYCRTIDLVRKYGQYG